LPARTLTDAHLRAFMLTPQQSKSSIPRIKLSSLHKLKYFAVTTLSLVAG
jgi:hypothetical protein